MTEKQLHTYWLHYIGVGIYGSKRFINEANRIGVNRAIPFNMLKNFKFGNSILLGEHFKTYPTAIDERKYARIFGYFNIGNLVLDKRLVKILLPELTVTKIKEDEDGKETERLCGSYSVGGSYAVKEDIPEIVEKIEKVLKAEGISPNSFKYFLSGKFKAFDTVILIDNVNFTRGYMKIKTEQTLYRVKEDTSCGVVFIYDYSKKKYLLKSEKYKSDSLLADEFGK